MQATKSAFTSGMHLPDSAALELRDGLTGMQGPIHCLATQTSGGSSTDELDDIEIEHFLNTLSEIAISIAARESAQGRQEVN